MNLRQVLQLVGNLTSKRVGMADIVLYDDLTRESVVFPVIPKEIPDVGYTQKNETFNGATQDITLVGNMGLRTYSMQNFLLPVGRKYSFARPKGSDGKKIVEFIKKRMEGKTIMRLAITYSDGTELLNMPCVCNGFSYHPDKIGDYHANIDFQEYVYVNTTNNSTTQQNNDLSGTKTGATPQLNPDGSGRMTTDI